MARRSTTAAKANDLGRGGPCCLWCHRDIDPLSPYRSDLPSIPGGREVVCGFECSSMPEGRRVYDLREPRPEFHHRPEPKVSTPSAPASRPGRGRLNGGRREPAEGHRRPGRGRMGGGGKTAP